MASSLCTFSDLAHFFLKIAKKADIQGLQLTGAWEHTRCPS